MSNIVSFQDMEQMANAIANSGLFGMKDKNSVLALMAVAQAEGLHPATAARDFHIIQGRPALKADAMLARFQQAGGQVDWKEYTDERVTGIFKHPNGGSLEVTWTIQQATKIGLVKPGSGWQKFPRAMLRSRCISEGIRSVFPGSVTGFYSPEEVADFTPEVKDITPKKVEPVNLVEMVDDVPEDSYILKLPDDSIYSHHGDLNEWMSAYAEMLIKVRDSKKIEQDVKLAKMEALKAVNKPTIDKLNNEQKIILLRLLQPQVEESPKELGSQSTME